MKPLTPAEFREALRKGLGRAAIHLREHGAAGLEADILHACLNSLGYDAQCEGNRGKWLWGLLDLAGMKETARTKILHALGESPPGWEDTWTVSQLFSLALLYAKAGDEEARQEIYAKFDRQQYNEEWLGGCQIISLDGMAGMIHVARVLGNRALNEHGYKVDDALLSSAKEQFGKEAVMTALVERGETDEGVRAFLDDIRRQELAKGQTQPKQPKSLQDVLGSIEQAQDRGLWLRRWARTASEQDIGVIFNAMLKEDRPAQLARFLQVFWKRPLPSIPMKVLDLAESRDEDVRNSAICALRNVCDQTVHDLAVRLLQQTPPVPGAVRLLGLTYKDDDHRLIESILPAHGEADDLHEFGFGILGVASSDPRLSTCLEWLYESGPCAECRYSAVRRLIESGSAKTEMLQECLLDCYEETREGARTALGLPGGEDCPQTGP